MDYASLREDGIRALERMNGGRWTDYNESDPGITLLEQVCYALTDLGYRTDYPIPDLLAEGGADPYASLHPPEGMLTCHPVTPADLRRLILDVEGVHNAWVLPVTADTHDAYYVHSGTSQIDRDGTVLPAEPLALRGLYRVIIDAADDRGSEIKAKVARCLHAHRGLCEDFASIEVLTALKVQVMATIEIGPAEDAAAVQADVTRRIADAISPPVPFATLSDLLLAGTPIDRIFDGPLLRHGFIADEALAAAPRREAIHASDVIRAIMDAPGVRAVSLVTLSGQQWSLTVPATMVAKLDVGGSVITVRRGGKRVVVPPGTPATAPPPAPPAAPGKLTPPAGRNRSVAHYMSVQEQLPEVYGIGEVGLPATATDARRGQAKQLQAYLLFFDQLMANHLAQLSHLKDLFSFDGGGTSTYFAQPIDAPALGLSTVRPALADARAAVIENAVLYQGLARGVDQERRGRFLNHLLARFGEVIDIHDLTLDLTPAKQAFLRRYPWLGAARGTGVDCLRPSGPDNLSGLERRVRLKLGLGDDEKCLVVEHILLRPIKEDAGQSKPFLVATAQRDPFSLQLTFVLKDGVGRYTDPVDPNGLKSIAGEIVRAETPAHLASSVLWLQGEAYEAFARTYQDWLSARRLYLAQRLNLDLRSG